MRLVHIAASLSVILFFAAAAAGQSDIELMKILEPVNASQRERLAKRLLLFMEHQRRQEWDKLFKLIDPRHIENKSTEDFAKLMTEWGRLDFTPERAEADHPAGEEYRIYGCVKIRRNGEIIFRQGGLIAYLQNNDWYFTTHFLSFDWQTAGELPCGDKTGKNKDKP